MQQESNSQLGKVLACISKDLRQAPKDFIGRELEPGAHMVPSSASNPRVCPLLEDGCEVIIEREP